jgi:hypothetical protein
MKIARNKIQSLLGIAATMACAVAEHAVATEYELRLRGDGEELVITTLSVEEDTAVASTGDITERFDLKKMAWLDEKTGRWVTMQESETALSSTKSATKAALEANRTAPPELLEFLEWSLEPSFKVSEEEGKLKLVSGKIDYTIEGKVDADDSDAYYKYAVLNSYKKAAQLKKLPPYPELRAIDEMKRRGGVPRKISVTIPGVPGAPAMEIEIVTPPAN